MEMGWKNALCTADIFPLDQHWKVAVHISARMTQLPFIKLKYETWTVQNKFLS